MDTKLEPKLAMWVDGTTYFHPWVHKVAQVVPKWCPMAPKWFQGCPKAPKMKPKWNQNGAKIEYI